jgi:hypothetical protein
LFDRDSLFVEGILNNFPLYVKHAGYCGAKVQKVNNTYRSINF